MANLEEERQRDILNSGELGRGEPLVIGGWLGRDGGGNVPGEDGPYRTPPPSETPPYPPKELANFIGPSGYGTTISEDAYWRGLQTIMETTEAGSDEQNKRLNILWHQFQDQVQNPKTNTDMMIAHGEYFDDEGEPIKNAPYRFNRNTTELEVPWLKEDYYKDLPRRKELHDKYYHR